MNAIGENTVGSGNLSMANDKLLSARAYAARLAMDRLQDEDANIDTRLLAAAVLNGLDSDVLRVIADSKKGWAI